MSWFAADPTVELDAKIEEATSESIPNGEMDMAVAMEITDMIRSKKVPPKQAMRGLKKRLTKVYANPNTLLATLKLCDVCVKNGGLHFLVEINSKEFIDYLVEYIFKVHYDVKKYQVYSSELKHAIGVQILKLVREWSMYFQDANQGNYLARTYSGLTNQGYEFPAVDTPLAANALNFIDSQTPPDWIDGKECMICYNPFSVMNRKHHCRACGGVFCQTHSSNNIPLVSLGIMQPVRVCDDCFQIHRHASERGEGLKNPPLAAKSSSRDTDEDEQLRKAIELSLQDLGVPVTYKSTETLASVGPTAQVGNSSAVDDEDDEDIKAAIEASLAEFKQAQSAQEERVYNQERPVAAPTQNPFSQPTEPELDFYLNMMPVSGRKYPSQYEDGRNTDFGQQQQYPQPQQNQHQHQTAPPRLLEDLSPQEEEDINLFVQLMGGIKSDPVKQANILYDQNLGELHSKVVRLKPKLNRALRSSIEKYECFLEMNNKINSITRLYDQFLDHKLSQTYNRHAISLPGASYNIPLQNTEQQYAQQLQNNQRQTSGNGPVQNLASPQTTGYQYELPYQPTAPQGLSHQHTATQGLPYQQTAPQGLPYQQTAPQGLSYQQTAPQVQAHDEKVLQTSPHQVLESQPMFEQHTTRADTGHHQKSNQSRFESQASESTMFKPQPKPETQARASKASIPYPTNPDMESPRFRGHEASENTNLEENQEFLARKNPQDQQYSNHSASSYPQVPSSPPSDGISDTESVTSRYPALEENFSENVNEEEKQDAEETGPREHASTRFPLINELNLPDLNAAPLADLRKISTSESRKYKAEPEPLIEL